MRMLLLLLASVSLYAEQHKVVHMIASPRSMSTAIFRMFENRDDFSAFHEPTMALFDRKHFYEYTKDWMSDCEFFSYEEMVDKILSKKADSHVIAKDVSFSSTDFIRENDEYIKNSDVHFIFLVRDPYLIANSFYKGDNFVDERYDVLIGMKQLYEIYQKVKSISPNQVQLLFTDDLLDDPELALRKVFNGLDIPFSEKSLSWEKMDVSFTGASWYEQKRHDLFQKWHGAALQSTHIMSSLKKVRPKEEDMFTIAKSQEDRDKLMKFYKDHLLYYNLFLKERKGQ